MNYQASRKLKLQARVILKPRHRITTPRCICVATIMRYADMDTCCVLTGQSVVVWSGFYNKRKPSPWPSCDLRCGDLLCRFAMPPRARCVCVVFFRFVSTTLSGYTSLRQEKVKPALMKAEVTQELDRVKNRLGRSYIEATSTSRIIPSPLVICETPSRQVSVDHVQFNRPRWVLFYLCCERKM